MGFGFGSFLIGKIYQAYTPSGVGIDQWRTSFLVFGVILFLVMFTCSFFIRKPTDKELEEITDSVIKKDKSKDLNSIEFTPIEMLKTPYFWIFFFWAILLSASGLAIVSQASGVAKEVGKDISASTVSTVVGLISIFNGIGRVIFGGLFDRIGRLKTMILNNLLFVFSVTILMLALKYQQFNLIILGFIFIGLSYGGITPTNSAFVNSYYGSKNYAVNLSLVNMNLLFASFGSTIAGSLYDQSGSYFSTLIAMIIAISIGFILTFMIKEKNKIQINDLSNIG